MTMDELKTAIRRDYRKWSFLTEVLGQHDSERPTLGVTEAGLVLVNPDYVEEIGVGKMVKLIRAELSVANVLRKTVRGMK